MGRVVLATLGSLGDLHPMMALGRGLRERGHTVVIATHEEYRSKIEALGLEFHAIRPASPGLDDPEQMAKVMEARKGTETVLKHVFSIARETYADLTQAAQGADFILAGEVVYVAGTVAEQLGIRWGFCALAPASIVSAYDMPVFSGVEVLATLRPFGATVNQALVELIKLMTRDWSAPLNQLRQELGLQPIDDLIIRGKFSPHLVLALFSPLLAQPQPDWPTHSVVTGSAFYDGSKSIAPELQQFLEAGEPPIVFTLGSAAVADPGNFFTESIAAVQQLSRRAVLLIGKNSPPQHLPETIAAFDYAPFSQLFPVARAIVHQGGVGTTAQALRSGHPTLIMPYSHDQPDNAARVERLGTSRTISRDHYTAPRVVKELRKLLSPQYAARAAEVGCIVQAEDGIRVACDAIDHQLD